MTARVLVGVEDSPEALAAGRTAVALCGEVGARLRVVHVRADGDLEAAIEGSGTRPGSRARRHRSGAAVLERVAGLARSAGVDVETDLLEGEVAPALLGAARAWHADLLVVGTSARAALGDPSVGSQTRHILEFAEQPVLVVPLPRRRDAPLTGLPVS